MRILRTDARARRAQAGFTLVEALVTLGIFSVLILGLTQFADFASSFQRINTVIGTQEKMRVARSAIIQAAQDVDGDGYYELLVPDAGLQIPASLNLGTFSTDEWGTTLRYCAYDLGNTNAVDNAFVSNSPTYVANHALGMIISAGKDKIFQTTCTDSSSQGDDFLLQVVEADVRHSKGGLGGFGHQAGEVSLVTPTDNVNLDKSLVTPLSAAALPLADPQGNNIKSGTLAYQTAANGARNAGLYVHDGGGRADSNWKAVGGPRIVASCQSTTNVNGYFVIQNSQTYDLATLMGSPGTNFYAGVWYYYDPFGLETCTTYISYIWTVCGTAGPVCVSTCTNTATFQSNPTITIQ